MQNKFYITTPIYYVNDVPHIGSAYTTIAADVLARYHRMIGDKTFFLTGTDEHGAKVEAQAREAGLEPQEFVNEIAAKFQFAWDELNISNDYFIRTTGKEHIKAVQKALQFMHEKGDIYKGKYEGLYCKGCEQYKSERDLVNGKCADHNVEPEKMSEECYMFKLSKYKDELLEKIKKDELIIRPEAKKNEVVNFYEKEGLNDIAFSRQKVKWGIPLPWDKSHTAYVWTDAFLNYLTGLPAFATSAAKAMDVKKAMAGEGWPSFAKATEGKSRDPRNEHERSNFQIFWPPDVQLMSKDIMRVHATIWPAMLLSLDLPLPKQIFVHGFFLVDGQKMSKSLDNVIRPEEMVQKYGVDGARYLLMSATSFGHDGDISWQWFDEKYNADLANGLGNLVARSITLANKSEFRAIIANMSEFRANKANAANIEEWEGQKFDHLIDKIWETYKETMEQLELDRVMEIISQQQRFLDNYITTTKPWELIKNNDKRAEVVMYNILERLRHIGLMVWPFMPETAEKIWQSLGLEPSKEMKKKFDKAAKWGGLEPGTKVKKGEALFPRI